MKRIIVFVTTCCLVLTALPLFAEEIGIYGRKLLVVDESVLGSTVERPPGGVIPSEDYLVWDGLRGLASYQLDPVWLPDGKTIACTTSGATSSIWLIPVDGGDPTYLYTPCWIYQGYYLGGAIIFQLCDITPDGKEIVFSTSVIDEDRGTKVTLKLNSDGSYGGCSVSNALPVIQAINIETKVVRTLAENSNYGIFSHNGKYFAFTERVYSEADGKYNLFLHIRDTATGTESTLSGISYFCFSADDAYIIYTNVNQLFNVPVTGGEPVQLTFETGDELTTRHTFPVCSPDGEWILFSGNGGARSNTISDSSGSHSYNIPAIQKLCAFNVYSGETVEFFPRDPAISSRSARFSSDGTKFCYVYENMDQLHQSIEVYIKDFDIPSQKESLLSAVEASLPLNFALLGNYPNPFNPSTTIEFSLPEAGFAELVIYNVMGQKVRELVTGTMTPGVHSVVWDGRDYSGKNVSAGVYFSHLRVNDKVVTGRMTLVK